MLSALSIAGGVALLLYAVRYLRKGLDRIFGRRLEPGMSPIAGSPARAFGAGLVTSLMTPSSTTISLLVARMAPLAPGRQMLLAMLGANIGLTVMVQFLGMRIEALAPVVLLIGISLFLLTSGSTARGTGQIVMSLGFMLLAIGIMKASVTSGALDEHPDFLQLVELVSGYPLLLAALAAIVTMALQSSTATIALLIGVGATGLLPIPLMLAVVAGANVGMALTTLIVAWGSIDARRVALANLLLKGAVAILPMSMLTFLDPDLAAPAPDALGLWIAQMHTGYNLLVALIGIPLSGVLMRWLDHLMPTPPEMRGRPFGPKFIDNRPIDSVALALGRSMQESLHAAEIVSSMLADVWTALRERDEQLANDVSDRDDRVDLLESRIKSYLVRIVREESSEEAAAEQMRQLRYLTELETIGDIIDKNIVELVLKRIRMGTSFSDEGWQELSSFHAKVAENMEIASMVFATRDETLAHQLLRHKERINRLEEQLRDEHFTRLNEARTDSHESSAIHLDLLTHLKRINSALSHVAYGVVGDTRRL